MKEIDILSHIGVSKEAAIIYTSLLQFGDMSISEVSKKASLHRPVVYKNIPYLEEIGLISQRVVGKRKLLVAESPENLRNIFENTKNNFEGVVWRFTEMFERKKIQKPVLKSIEWENFAKHIFDDIAHTLWKDGTYYRYSSARSLYGQHKYTHYKKIRDEKNIQRMIITSDYLAKTKPKSISHEVVSIPKNYDLFDDDVSRVIYADKVGIIDYANQISFIIQNQKLANFEKKIFKLLFRYLR